MLPDILSGDLCSLHEGVDRACLAVRMRLDAQGHKRRHRFVGG
jgi:ribonuclease R